MVKRIVAMLVALVVALVVSPTTPALSTNESGTQGDPAPGSLTPRVGSIIISTPTDLFALQDDSTHWQGSTITLANNIVMPDDSIITRPIGTLATPFTSDFDGNLKSIGNLRVAVTGSGSSVLAGLFGFVGVGGAVRSLTVIDDSITGVSTGGADAFAGLVAASQGTVSNVRVSGEVSVQGASGYGAYAGGLVGTGLDDTIARVYVDAGVTASGFWAFAGGVIGGGQGTRISESASLATVAANSNGSFARAGGVAGQLDNYAGRPGTVTDSYAQGDVSVAGSGDAALGGIIGYSFGSSAVITRTYYSGLAANDPGYAGTLVRGGLVGDLATGNSIAASYYSNVNPSDVGTSSGSTRDDTALSPTAMQQFASYSTWPIVGTWESPGTNTWGICEGQSYPYLLWQAYADPCVTALSVSGTAEVGQTLTASVTAADDSSLRWGWLDGGVFAGILETNSQTYVVRSADIGHRMAVRVISRSGTAEATDYSTPTAIVPGPPPPSPTYPPSAPGDVTAVAGDKAGTVSWSVPSSSGSFAISNYQVRSTPASDGCMTAELSCEITGLVNGTAYAFEVRALNGAGWGPWSVASEPVTPGAAASIVITGTRGRVEGKPGVVVDGTTTGLVGAMVTPWVRFPGQSSYSEGTGTRTVDAEGKFSWQRQTGKRIYVIFRAGDIKSNRLVIRR